PRWNRSTRKFSTKRSEVCSALGRQWQALVGSAPGEHAQWYKVGRPPFRERACTSRSLVPRTRSSRTPSGKCDRELRVQRGTGIMELLVVLGSRSSRENGPRNDADFGIGPLEKKIDRLSSHSVGVCWSCPTSKGRRAGDADGGQD